MSHPPISSDEFSVPEFSRSLMPDWENTPDEWFAWPPDLFALTSQLLRATGIYRLVVSPPVGKEPINLFAISSDREPAVSDAGDGLSESDIRDWYSWIWSERDTLPEKLLRRREILFDADRRLDCYGGRVDYDLFKTIMELHGLADQACRGLGMSARPEMRELSFLGSFHLAVTGSLSRLPKHHGVVLPKCRVPQTGLSLRSLSHHLTFHQSEVSVQWRSIPWVNRADHENTINVLAVPYPYVVSPRSFKGQPNPDVDSAANHFRYFAYEPNERLDVSEVLELLERAYAEVEHIHVLVFPELALTDEELRELKAALPKLGRPAPGLHPRQVPLIVAGVRGKAAATNLTKDALENAGGSPRPTNQVELSAFFANKWYDLRQSKHHRWKLTASQVQDYALAGTLSVRDQWWEDTEIAHRRLSFLVPNGWLSLAPLICEDLARLEPVSDLIRGVGPTLVMATLMDGPQLKERWPARYVGVLADDPGTSILTLTSLGMARRCQPRGRKADSTALLWKDQESGAHPVECTDDTGGILLSLNAVWTEEFTADSRTDRGNAAQFVLQSARLIPRPQRQKTDVPSPAELGNPEADGLEGQRTATYSDLIEITALCYLVDAALDADRECARHSDALNRLCSWALVSEEPLGGDQIRSFPLLWGRLSRRMRDAWKNTVESSDQGREYIRSVERVIKFLSGADKRADDDERDSEVPAERYAARLSRWSTLLRKVAAEFAMAPSTTDSRVDDLAYLAILWGIHNRVVRVRRQFAGVYQVPGHLHSQSHDLLQDIERLLEAHDHKSGTHFDGRPEIRLPAAQIVEGHGLRRGETA